MGAGKADAILSAAAAHHRLLWSTRSSTAMGASQDWYHMRVSLRLWIPVEYGRLHGASPEMSRYTKATRNCDQPRETI